jgi:hypothetical protein
MNAENKEYFDRGRSAQRSGETTNPYSGNSLAGLWWQRGWLDAWQEAAGEPLSIHDLKQEIADENLEEEEEWSD